MGSACWYLFICWNRYSDSIPFTLQVLPSHLTCRQYSTIALHSCQPIKISWAINFFISDIITGFHLCIAKSLDGCAGFRILAAYSLVFTTRITKTFSTQNWQKKSYAVARFPLSLAFRSWEGNPYCSGIKISGISGLKVYCPSIWSWMEGFAWPISTGLPVCQDFFHCCAGLWLKQHYWTELGAAFGNVSLIDLLFPNTFPLPHFLMSTLYWLIIS